MTISERDRRALIILGTALNRMLKKAKIRLLARAPHCRERVFASVYRAATVRESVPNDFFRSLLVVASSEFQGSAFSLPWQKSGGGEAFSIRSSRKGVAP